MQVHIKGVQGPFQMASGVPLKALPAGAWLHRAEAKAPEGGGALWVGVEWGAVLSSSSPHACCLLGACFAAPSFRPTTLPSPAVPTRRAAGKEALPGAPVLGLLRHGSGRVALYGDSNCLDSSHSRSKCFKLLSRLLAWAGGEVGGGGGWGMRAAGLLCCSLHPVVSHQQLTSHVCTTCARCPNSQSPRLKHDDEYR